MKSIPNYTISYDFNLNAVICVWQGYSSSSEFRQSTEELLMLLIKEEATKMLVDLKNMVLIGGEDQEWLVSSYIPRGMQYGLAAIAVVQTDYYFNKIAVESISFKLKNKPLYLRHFDTYTEAREWLLHQA